MQRVKRLWAAALGILLWQAGILQADVAPPAVYVIYDSSNSMWAETADGSRRYEAARTALESFLTQDFGGRDIALRVYGHRRADDCSDSELVLAFGPSTGRADEINRLVSALRPKGRTPIDLSLRQALVDFADRPGDIVLITDGIESCDADPCALMEEWRNRNVAIRVHVVGFGVTGKEKAGLQCIADAAGTDFLVAGDSEELTAGLASIKQHSTDTSFRLEAKDSRGNDRRARGVLEGARRHEVATNSRYVVEPGSYTLTAGMELLTGELYKPVSLQVDIPGMRETISNIEVVVPPRVTPDYGSERLQLGESLVRVSRNNSQLATFRAIDSAYLAPGTYSFVLKDATGQDMLQTVTLRDGDDITVTFAPPRVVTVVLHFVPVGGKQRILANAELWQNSEKVTAVHVNNGARVRPGPYNARLNTDWITFAADISVADAPAHQLIEIPVPVGYVTVLYQDVDGNQVPHKRVALGRGTENRGRMRSSGEALPLSPGVYNAVGWRGRYDTTVFEIMAGEQKTIVLREKPEP